MGHFAIPPALGGKFSTDQAIAWLGTRQHGVVASWQLTAAGVGDRAIEHRRASDRLHRIHQGVYAVGHRALTKESFLMAAVLACGDDAVLSGRAAAHHHRIYRVLERPYEVSVPAGRAAPRRRGVSGRSVLLAKDEITVKDRIPVTTFARTALDLAALTYKDEDALAYVYEAVLQRNQAKRLATLVERYPRRPGVPALRKLLSDHARHTGMSRSDFEKLVLLWLQKRGFPRPELNGLVPLADGTIYMPDLMWTPVKLIVELDTSTYHGNDLAKRRDDSRDRDLLLEGWTVFHIWPADLEGKRADRLLTQLRQALGPTLTVRK